MVVSGSIIRCEPESYNLRAQRNSEMEGKRADQP